MAIANPPPRLRREPPDERLVARVRAGDEAAFARLFERHAPGLLSFCRHMLASREEAEDAVQHVFLSAHRAMRATDRELRLRPWLYAIARNRCLSLLRARREHDVLDDATPPFPPVEGLAAEVERREDLRALLADLRRLPDDQRAALVLAELGALSHDEIAQILDVRHEKVKALVFQAREALIGARRAREIPCAEIREELATARGGALRRAHLRRHLEACEGCREFRGEVSRQRAALAILLPVVPPAALKAAVLGAGLGGASAAGAGLLAGAKGAAAKLLLATAVAGTAGAGGYVAVKELRAGESGGAAAAGTPRRHARPVAAHAVAARTSATPVAAHGSPPPTLGRRVEQVTQRAAPVSPAGRRGPRVRHHEPRSSRAAAPIPGAGRPAVPPGLAKQDRPAPGNRPAVPPGQAKKQAAAPPVPQAHPPTHAATPPGQAKKQAAPPPGQAEHAVAPPPGQAKSHPSQAATPPASGETEPSGVPPGLAKHGRPAPPGHGGGHP